MGSQRQLAEGHGGRVEVTSQPGKGSAFAIEFPAAQDWPVFAVPSIVVYQPQRRDDSPEASLEIPTDWLMPWLDLDAVRQAQRVDTVATMTGEHLSLSGVELVVERRWLREAYWRQIKQAITRGYIYKSSAVQVTLRGERRERDRRASSGLSKAS